MESLSTSLHAGIKMLYKEESLTDVVIQVGAKTFPCHKLVLSAMSSYFKTMFTSDFQDKQQDTVTVESVSPEIFECILQYIYYSNVNVINAENAQDILSASCMFLIQHIQEKCETFITERLNPENAINIWKYSSTLPCVDLQKSSKSYILQNFEEVSKSDYFLELQSEEMSEIIKDENLNVSREEIVGEAVFRWFTAKKDERQESLYSVLQHVRFPLTPAYYIFDICERFPLLSNPGDLSQLVDEAKYFHSCGIIEKGNTSSRFVHRKSSNTTDALMFLCCSEDTMSTYAYSFLENKWATLNKGFKEKGSLFAACVYRNDVFLSGGHRDLKGKMMKFQYGKNIWSTCSSFGKQRFRHAMLATSGLLFLVGGSCASMSVLSDVDEYNPSTNSYSSIGKLLIPVRSVDAVALKHKIFVFGGKPSNVGDGTTHIQCFDLNNRQCSKIQPDLPVPFIRSGALVVDEGVYLFSKHGHILEWTADNTFVKKMELHDINLNDNDTPSKSLCYFGGNLYIACSNLPLLAVDVDSGKSIEFKPPGNATDFINLLKCILPKKYFQ